MAKVFISYIHENIDLAIKLKNDLEAYGIEVWFDKTSLSVGDRWEQKVKEGIETGDFFIACFSKEYEERSSTYQNKELLVAIGQLQLMQLDRKWFFPVKLNECNIPKYKIDHTDDLSSIQALSIFENWGKGVWELASIMNPDITEPLDIEREINSVEDQKLSIEDKTAILIYKHFKKIYGEGLGTVLANIFTLWDEEILYPNEKLSEFFLVKNDALYDSTMFFFLDSHLENTKSETVELIEFPEPEQILFIWRVPGFLVRDKFVENYSHWVFTKTHIYYRAGNQFIYKTRYLDFPTPKIKELEIQGYVLFHLGVIEGLIKKIKDLHLK